MEEELTKEILVKLLREAEVAHAEYEKTLDARDEHWAAWYATYIIDALNAS